MKNNLFKSLSILALSIVIVGCSGANGQKDSLGNMGSENASVEESFTQARLTSLADGFFSIANSKILEKDYSYEKNKKVKEKVDKEIKQIEANNPDVLSMYGLNSMMELMIKSGSLLQVQEEEYARDRYIKEYVSDKTLKKLYDQKAGELITYHVISFGPQDFEGDMEAYDKEIANIEGELAKANKDNVVKIFEELAKKYNNQIEGANNGKQDSVSRDEIDENVLKKLDGFKYMQFNKKAIDIDDTKYFILKSDKGERLSFKDSKERLKEYQYTNAVSENSYLVDYLLTKMRAENNVSFVTKRDQDVYDQATKIIIDNYNEANKAAKDGK